MVHGKGSAGGQGAGLAQLGELSSRLARGGKKRCARTGCAARILAATEREEFSGHLTCNCGRTLQSEAHLQQHRSGCAGGGGLNRLRADGLVNCRGGGRFLLTKQARMVFSGDVELYCDAERLRNSVRKKGGCVRTLSATVTGGHTMALVDAVAGAAASLRASAWCAMGGGRGDGHVSWSTLSGGSSVSVAAATSCVAFDGGTAQCLPPCVPCR
eukprot:TRINITY_DN8869_c0_g1_i5.p1 TRINITY_DN8869_c0_g1~~TRINITY_DN8869_c0_g1_i5.p1  ORF type:complete len:214 (+),score=38.25 TRINITY_DN8869_c0_g1_i5:102-743(+)